MTEMAYVMINLEGKTNVQDILEHIRKVEGIKQVHAVYGQFDIVVLIEAEDMEQLKKSITDNIRLINGVKSSLTMPVMV